MLISVACYQLWQLSPFLPSLQNYKTVVPMALFIPSETAGDNYAQETHWEETGSEGESKGQAQNCGRQNQATGSVCGLRSPPLTPPLGPQPHRSL